MESRLNLTQNAYFYKQNKKLTKSFIESLVSESSQHKKGHFIYKKIRNSISYLGENFDATLCIFDYESKPSFLIAGTEIEIKYGYFLALEYKNYLIISKRGTTDFSKLLKTVVTELDAGILSKFRVDKSTKFKKMALTNMDTNQKVIRKQSLEADDIKEVLSTLSTSNKVINSMRVKNNKTETSISISTSRINELNQKANLQNFCIWTSTIISKYTRYKAKSNYIDNFAQHLNFKSSIPSLTPISILFLLYDLVSDLSEGLVNKIFYQPDLADRKVIREINLSAFLELNDLCLDLTPTTDSSVFTISNSFDKTLQLKIYSTEILIQSEKLRKIFIEYSNGEFDSLLNYIVKESHFMIAFDNADVRYHLKRLFKDSKLLGNINYFLSYVETNSSLLTLTSEKGKITKSSKNFSPNTLFNFIEKKISMDCNYLMCDDLGDEWADYIGFKTNDTIRFYHAKSSKKGFSASALHDLVSQALKNIGNFDFNTNLTQKTSKVGSYYSTSLIPRLRKGDTPANFMKKIKETFNHRNIRKEVFLVINFLSKKELNQELTKLKSKSKCKNQTVQLLWILSSLIGSCQERGIALKIITTA